MISQLTKHETVEKLSKMDIKVTVNPIQEDKINQLIRQGSKSATESNLKRFFGADDVEIEPTFKTSTKTRHNTPKQETGTLPEWLSDLPDFDRELSLI